MKNIAGIDFSLKNTGLSILDENGYHFYIFAESKPVGLLNDKVKYIPRRNKEKTFQRYIDLAGDITSIIKEHNVEKVFIEDYALTKIEGYKINLIEATAVLKHKLILEGVEIDKVSVTNVKKKATNYGASDKEAMVSAFLSIFPDFKDEIMKLKKYAYDICDAFFVLKAKEG